MASKIFYMTVFLSFIILSQCKYPHRVHPQLNECVKESVELLRPMLNNGIPEFGIPSIEPLIIPEVVLDQGSGAISVRSTYTNIKVFGPSQFILKSVKIDQEKNRVRIKLWLPSLYLVSKYKMDGRILMMPISGSGISRGNYTNIDATVTMQGEKIDKDGEEYFNIKDFYVDFNIGHASIHLEDLFGGDRELDKSKKHLCTDTIRINTTGKKRNFLHEENNAPLLKEKPKWLKICSRNDPELNQCLQDMFQLMFPELASGIPEINVEPFEPLHLDRVAVSKGSGAVTLAGSLSNMTVRGPSKAIPTYSDIDLDNRRFNFGINLPQLDIKAMYNLKGKILVLPLVGHGAADIVLNNVRTNVKTVISFPFVEGREIFKVENMKVEFALGSITVNLENLFNGNKILGTTVNNFLNKNALEVVGELSDNIGESLAEIFTDLMNNIFCKIPTDLWFPKENSTLSS
ncbi:uncharacterized protein CBL_06223 [Carabus blaptoides fortunei]